MNDILCLHRVMSLSCSMCKKTRKISSGYNIPKHIEACDDIIPQPLLMMNILKYYFKHSKAVCDF